MTGDSTHFGSTRTTTGIMQRLAQPRARMAHMGLVLRFQRPNLYVLKESNAWTVSLSQGIAQTTLHKSVNSCQREQNKTQSEKLTAVFQTTNDVSLQMGYKLQVGTKCR